MTSAVESFQGPQIWLGAFSFAFASPQSKFHFQFPLRGKSGRKREEQGEEQGIDWQALEEDRAETAQRVGGERSEVPETDFRPQAKENSVNVLLGAVSPRTPCHL